MKKAAGAVTVVVFFLTNCGGGSGGPGPSTTVTTQLSVAISPGGQQKIDQGQTVKFTASVTNDSSRQGVSWSVAGSGCSGNTCGTLTNSSSTATTYNAPVSVSSALNVTVKANSVAKSTASASATVTVNPPPAVTTSSLPGGTVGTAYSTTLQSSGGTGPVSWSITSGSLPAGFSLNAGTGVISGTPTAAGPSNFAVKVTDSAPVPMSATQSFSIVIADRLIITTTLLPNGTVNLAYSATLQAGGGTGPFSWSIASGNLPAGLSLDASTGVISGTPTNSQKSSFTVQVADSTSQTTTQQLSIIIEPPLTIATTALADGTVSVAYSATVEADYATLPVSWSISSGSLPAGLFLDAASGKISGTPTAPGTSNFTVMVTDSSSPAQTATQPLSITVNASGMNNTELSGRYAFLLSGYDSHGNRVAAAGSFVADGAGTISSGVEDLNDTGLPPETDLTLTGTYTVNADNRGAITITNSAGDSYTMAIAVGSVVGGTAEKGSAVEFDSSGYTMSGVIEFQDSSKFYTGAVTGNYAFRFTGSDMAGSRMGVAGEFTADGTGDITGGQFDADDNGTPTADAAIANTSTYAVDTSTGRGTATLGGVSPAPADYAFYVVSASRLLALSTDTASTSGLVTGEIDTQSGGPYSDGSLDATAVMALDSAAASGSQVTLGVVTFNGSGGASFSLDNNAAGTLSSVAGTGTYTTPDSATGRFTLAPPAGLPGLVGYLVSPNQAFVLGAGSNVTAGTFQQQSAGPFADSSMSFTAMVGDQAFATTPAPPPKGFPLATLATGVVTFDGAGNVSATNDRNELGTLYPDQSSTDTYSVSSTGRVSLGSGSSIFYIVSPGEFATMGATPGDPNPTVGFGRQ